MVGRTLDRIHADSGYRGHNAPSTYRFKVYSSGQKRGAEFAYHGTVNHSTNEYTRLGGFVGINDSENFFSIVNRGIIGTYHSVSEAHLHRYLAEFDFRYNTRSGLVCEDAERTERSLRGIVGTRLTYRDSSQLAFG